MTSWSSFPTGWSKASLSADASEENDGYSSGEDPMNSDTEEDAVKKLVRILPKEVLFKMFVKFVIKITLQTTENLR